MKNIILFLSLIFFCLCISVRADQWANPEKKNIYSQSKKYLVKIIPGYSIGDLDGFKGAPTGDYAKAEFFKRNNAGHYELLKEIFLVNPVAPVNCFLNNDNYLITLDNWHNKGYGKIVAIYSPDGKLIKSYELKDLFSKKEIEQFSSSTSSIEWQNDNYNSFDETGNIFYIWINTKQRVLAWNMKTGEKITVTEAQKKRWNKKFRKKALEKIKNRKAKFVDYKLLSEIKNSEDKIIFQELLKNTHLFLGTRQYYSRPDLITYFSVFTKREIADQILLNWDKPYSNISICYNGFSFLGSLELTVTYPCYPKKGEGNLVVYLMESGTNKSSNSNIPENYLVVNLKKDYPRNFNKIANWHLSNTVNFSFRGVSPGTYKIFALWDRKKPFTENKFPFISSPGDFFAKTNIEVKIIAGEITKNIHLQCSNQSKTNNIMKKYIVELADEFVVVAFGGPTLKNTTLPRFKEIADANIDVLVPGNQSDDGPSNLKALDLAEKAGIRILTWDKRVCPMAVTTSAPIDYAAIKAMTDDYKNHPAFAGYVIRDEPDVGIFPRLAELRKLYLEKDPSHEPFINLFPSYADNKQLGARDFQDYLDKFIKIVNPSIISYDNYALLADNIASPEEKEKREEIYFNDLKVVGETAGKAGIPFWNFILSAGVKSGTNDYLRVPTRAEILWQANTALAYGSHGVCWFCCWTPKIATLPGALEMNEEYFGGMINGDGSRNPMYDYLKEENAFLRKNGRRLVGWNCAHNARYKNGKKVNGDSPAATPIGKDFDLVIGTFVKGDKRNLVIVNASYKKSADFSFSKAVKHKIIDTIDADFDNKKSAWKLHPGGCVILDCIN